jgi:nucleoside-diphosphate-sugar epimerase
MVIDRAESGAVFNIASPSPISIIELARLLNDAALPQPLGPVEHATEQHLGMRRVNFNSTDASVSQLRALGWDARTGPLEGFKRTLRHYQESSA